MTRNPGAGFPAPAYTPPVVAGMRHSDNSFTRNVVCVWWGDKYGIDYVYRLKAACNRWMKEDFNFYCLSDHADSVLELSDHDIIHLQSPEGINGWWQKLYLFNEDLWDADERILMLDLDAVLTGPMDQFFDSIHHTTAIANFGVNFRHAKYNSSVVCWDPYGPASKCWHKFKNQITEVERALHGDQCFFWRVMLDDVRVWPDNWCVSYKYEVRGGKGLQPDTRAVIFHGKPDPHEVRDPFITENWTNIL